MPTSTEERTPLSWIQIDLGKDLEDADYYISAEERLRVAMARQ